MFPLIFSLPDMKALCGIEFTSEHLYEVRITQGHGHIRVTTARVTLDLLTRNRSLDPCTTDPILKDAWKQLFTAEPLKNAVGHKITLELQQCRNKPSGVASAHEKHSPPFISHHWS